MCLDILHESVSLSFVVLIEALRAQQWFIIVCHRLQTACIAWFRNYCFHFSRFAIQKTQKTIQLRNKNSSSWSANKNKTKQKNITVSKTCQWHPSRDVEPFSRLICPIANWALLYPFSDAIHIDSLIVRITRRDTQRIVLKNKTCSTNGRMQANRSWTLCLTHKLTIRSPFWLAILQLHRASLTQMWEQWMWRERANKHSHTDQLCALKSNMILCYSRQSTYTQRERVRTFK